MNVVGSAHTHIREEKPGGEAGFRDLAVGLMPLQARPGRGGGSIVIAGFIPNRESGTFRRSPIAFMIEADAIVERELSRHVPLVLSVESPLVISHSVHRRVRILSHTVRMADQHIGDWIICTVVAPLIELDSTL